MLAMMISTYTASRSSSHPEDTYWCKGCKTHFDEDDYRSIEVLYNPTAVSTEPCGKCGVTYDDSQQGEECRYNGRYFMTDTGDTESAWLCPNGCFHHDDGSCPGECEGECGIAEFSTQTFTVEVWECGKCQSTYAADAGDYEDKTPEEANARAREDAGKCCS